MLAGPAIGAQRRLPGGPTCCMGPHVETAGSANSGTEVRRSLKYRIPIPSGGGNGALAATPPRTFATPGKPLTRRTNRARPSQREKGDAALFDLLHVSSVAAAFFGRPRGR